jgi:putative phosphotransacetylase
MRMKVQVGVSNRHIHLSQADLEALFGKGYQLEVLKELSQPGQYAAKETLEIEGPKGKMERVRVLGPSRTKTQVEISRADSFTLGIQAPVRESGDLQGTPGLRIIGPRGTVEIQSGVIVAARHIHLHPTDAERFGVRDGDIVKVEVNGERALTFDQVHARVNPSYALEMHIDTDEANAAGVVNGQVLEAEVVRIAVLA